MGVTGPWQRFDGLRLPNPQPLFFDASDSLVSYIRVHISIIEDLTYYYVRLITRGKP